MSTMSCNSYLRVVDAGDLAMSDDVLVDAAYGFERVVGWPEKYVLDNGVEVVRFEVTNEWCARFVVRGSWEQVPVRSIPPTTEEVDDR